MVRYDELIYEFVDRYLQTATECAICKESYDMGNDTDFLYQYMNFFISLVIAAEQDGTMEMDSVRATLDVRRERCLQEFRLFLEDKVMEKAVNDAREMKDRTDTGMDIFSKMVELYGQKCFSDDTIRKSESPSEMLEYIRHKEENMEEDNG